MARRFLCGVPVRECKGTVIQVNALLRGKDVMRAHSDRNAAFRCYAGYLVRLGYVRVGTREFENPESGAILVLPKRIRFGAELRGGKGGEKGASRYVPRRARGGTRSGVMMP